MKYLCDMCKRKVPAVTEMVFDAEKPGEPDRRTRLCDRCYVISALTIGLFHLVKIRKFIKSQFPSADNEGA